MKGKTIVDTEKLQELLKLARAFENPLGEAESDGTRKIHGLSVKHES